MNPRNANAYGVCLRGINAGGGMVIDFLSASNPMNECKGWERGRGLQLCLVLCRIDSLVLDEEVLAIVFHWFL